MVTLGSDGRILSQGPATAVNCAVLQSATGSCEGHEVVGGKELNQKTNNKPSGAKLVVAEDIAKGRVSWAASGSILPIFLVILSRYNATALQLDCSRPL